MPSQARHPRERAAEGPRSTGTGPGPLRAWGVLDRDRRFAAVAAVLLFVTMLLPWYQQNAVVSAAKTEPLISRNLNAFAVFSFVEAAVLLVAIAVLALLYLRAEGRTFQLPGGDGAVVFAAGIWTALLLVLRLFDKPGIAHNGVAANIGVQWGIFFALAAAGLLAYAGSRMRAARRPGPPLLRADQPPPRAPRQPPRYEREDIHARAVPTAAQAPAFEREAPAFEREAPAFEREPHVSADEDITVVTPRRASAAGAVRTPAPERPAATADGLAPATPAGRRRYPPAPPSRPRRSASEPEPAEQLSFEDPPPDGR